jgi:ribonuclease HII
VGRGCLAGPVVAGAVILKSQIEGLNDSKKLTKKKREILFSKILENSVCSF